jgi:peptidoglycan/xylan/chitin deacetylase (PgdA/CDA1 family)
MRLLPGRVTIKRAIKRTAGLASTWLRPFVSDPAGPCVCILVYHRIAPLGFVDPDFDSWNVTPDVLDRHIASLADTAEIIALEDVPRRMRSTNRTSKPLVCLTFDDGFANFHREALPVLRRYQAKATLFVVTRFVDREEPMPFDRWARRHCADVPPGWWQAITWKELDDCVQSGLVTIGSHSHEHRIGSTCTPDELRHEAGESRALLLGRLGARHAACYSYPYGSSRPPLVPADYVRAVRAAGYELAVSTDLGLADTLSDPFFLPRIEAFSLDSPAVLRAKVGGVLTPYIIPQWLRTARRSA